MQSCRKPYLGVDPDDLLALVAVVSKDALVALDAVGMVVAEDVAVPGQGVVAVVAKHLLLVIGLASHAVGVAGRKVNVQFLFIFSVGYKPINFRFLQSF